MKEIIIGIIGIIAAAIGVVMLAMTLNLKRNGVAATGEVVSFEQDEKHRYYHNLKYMVNGREYISRDKAGYSRNFEQGELKNIVCSGKNPEKFRYDEEIRSNLILSVCSIIIGIGIILRFL